MKKTGVMTAAVLAASFAIPAVAQLSVEDQIEARQAGYQFMAWNMGKIKAQAVDGDVEFNADQMKAAANAIAAIANSGMGALYSPDKVREVGTNFVREANKLQEVAATGDRGALARQFSAVGQTCKACHDNFRAD
jgi:cytochrome c556